MFFTKETGAQNPTMVLRGAMLTSLGKHRQPATEKAFLFCIEKRVPTDEGPPGRACLLEKNTRKSKRRVRRPKFLPFHSAERGWIDCTEIYADDIGELRGHAEATRLSYAAP